MDSDRLGLGLLFYRTYFQVRGNFTGGELELEIPAEPRINKTVDRLLAATLHGGAPRSSAEEWQRVRHLRPFLESLADGNRQPTSSRSGRPTVPTYGKRQTSEPAAASAPPTFDPTAPPSVYMPERTTAPKRRSLSKGQRVAVFSLTLVLIATVVISIAIAAQGS